MVPCGRAITLLLCSLRFVALAGLQSSGLTSEENNVYTLLQSSLPSDVFAELGWNDHSISLADLRAVRVHHVGDFFCGAGGISTAAVSSNLRSIWMDVECDPSHDLTSTRGYVKWVRACLTITRGGTAVFGFPCCTYCWLAMGHTGRSKTRPLGFQHRADVFAANIMFERLLVLLRLLSLRVVWWLVENPLRSLLWAQPPLETLMRIVKIKTDKRRHRVGRFFTWLGAFGCAISKPVVFLGICPGGRYLTRKLPARFKRLAQVATFGWVSWLQKQPDGSLKRRFMGRKKLRESGVYPPELCATMVRVARWQQAHLAAGTL